MTEPSAEPTTVIPATGMAWDAWGSPDARKELSPQIRGLISQVFGVSGESTAHRAADAVRLRPAALPARVASELNEIVGAQHVVDDHATRLLHAGGKSTFDLLNRRSDDVQDAPDAVVLAADHDQVLAVLQCCSDNRVAVVPFGGGSSVVGGVDPERGGAVAVIALDLRRLDELEAVDPVSLTATLGAGVTGPVAEKLLAAHGLSLGHFPQSFQYASIGGFAATRSSGQASAGYGRFDDMVQHLRVATPRGTLELGRAPASAAGPDLRELFVGSEGAFGVITSVTVRVHPIPEATAYQAWSFPDFGTGAAALRALVQSGAAPTVLRLSDEAETGINLARTERIGDGDKVQGCLAITTVEGTERYVETRSAHASAILSEAGGTALGEDAARQWEQGRFGAPYLRDSLLDAGVLCETLETATTWANLSALRNAVTTALTDALTGQGTAPLVMCHISHTYSTGASLYFTVICAQADDPAGQWRIAKKAAGDAIAATGGTITHHHAVGVDHRQWLPDEVGELGIEVLRAVKQTLDPAGIMNPGKLIP